MALIVWLKIKIKLLSVFEWLSLGLALIGNFFLQLNSFYGINYHSDDVGQQVLFHNWLKFGVHGTSLGPDPFLFKIPFHIPIEWLFGNSRRSILFAAYSLSALFIIGAFFGLRYFAKKIKSNDQLYLVFLASFPWAGSIYSFASMLNYKNANLRSVELGIWFLVLALIARYFYKHKSPKRSIAWPMALAVFSGFLFFNDTGMILFCWVPVALLISYKYLVKEDRSSLKLASTALFGSLFFYEFFKILFDRLGVHLYKPALEIVSLGHLWPATRAGIINFFALCDANFIGKFIGMYSIVQMVNFTVVIVGLGSSFYLLRSKRTWQRFFGAQPFILFGAYVLSGSATDVTTSRYLILVPFYFSLIYLYTASDLLKFGKKTLAYTMGVLIMAATLLNIGSSMNSVRNARNFYYLPNYTRNEKEISAADSIRRLNLTKGYATYGEANLIGYFSGYQATVTPIYCGDAHIHPYRLLMTDKQLKEHADKVFIIALEEAPQYFVPTKYPALNLPAGVDYACPREKIVSQFGEPAEQYDIAPDMKMLIYNHDLDEIINSTRSLKTNPIN